MIEITAHHAPVLAALHAPSFDAPWDEDAFSALLAVPGTFGFIAGPADDPKGFVLARLAGDEAEILTITVLPNARRQGLARALMQAVLDHVRQAGGGQIFLEVAADNPQAMALYQNLGFSEVGLRKGYYARADKPRVDAHVLALSL